MKTIGIIGGFSWVSTIDYYRAINIGVNQKLGNNNSANCIIHSINYQDIIDNNNSGNTEGTYKLIYNAGLRLKISGAAGILIAANTMNMFAERLQYDLKLPVIHIAEVTAEAIRSKGLKKVGLLGTKFTMEMPFYKDKLKEKGIETITPNDPEREFVHKTIFDELGKDIILESTKKEYLSIIKKLVEHGAEGIILGCTEIPLLIKDSDYPIPLFNTTLIHSSAGVNFILND